MGTVEQVREPLGKRLIPVFGAAVVNGNGVDTDLLDILNAVSEPRIVALERHSDPIRTLHAGSFKGLIQPQHLLRSTELFRAPCSLSTCHFDGWLHLCWNRPLYSCILAMSITTLLGARRQRLRMLLRLSSKTILHSLHRAMDGSYASLYSSGNSPSIWSTLH